MVRPTGSSITYIISRNHQLLQSPHHSSTAQPLGCWIDGQPHQPLASAEIVLALGTFYAIRFKCLHIFYHKLRSLDSTAWLGSRDHNIKYVTLERGGVREGVTVCERRRGPRACDVTLLKFLWNIWNLILKVMFSCKGSVLTERERTTPLNKTFQRKSPRTKPRELRQTPCKDICMYVCMYY